MAFTVTLREFGGKVEAQVGDYVAPDGWQKESVGASASWQGQWLTEGDEPVDADYQGSDFRLPSGTWVDVSSPVNITVTGRKVHFTNHQGARVRVQIEWVRDGEEIEFSGGWMTLISERPEANYRL